MSRILLGVLFLLAACGDSFDPAQRVQSLRFLGVMAEPPELVPGTVTDAALTSLVVDPRLLADEAARVTTLYFACTPGGFGEYPCTSYEDLRVLPDILEGAGTGACEAGEATLGELVPGVVVFAGAEVCDADACSPVLGGPTLSLPADLDLDALLPATDVRRVLGVEVVVVAVALPVTPDELGTGDACARAAAFPRAAADWLRDEKDNATAVKRVIVRGPEATDAPNVNPPVPELLLAGAPLEGVPALGGESARFTLGEIAQGEYQDYTRYDPITGEVIESLREEYVFSWFVTGGELDVGQTRAPGEVQEYFLPDGSEDRPYPPEGDTVRIWVVTRDFRGGTSWTFADVTVPR